MKPRHVSMYMEIADTVARQSYAERLKVGAVAVRGDRILSIGYNGTPPGTDNCCEETVVVDGKSVSRTNDNVIHAEMNLIYKLARDGESGRGADLFITHSPCHQCAKAILSVGFSRVWFRTYYRDDLGVVFLKKNGVEVSSV